MSGRDLADHHDGRDGDNEPCPALIAQVPVTEEYVIVGPWLEGVRVHGPILGDAASSRGYMPFNEKFHGDAAHKPERDARIVTRTCN